jgi:enoyl-CoA hydratase
MTDNVLRVEIEDRVAVLTLDRPAVRNALNSKLQGAIVEAVRTLDDDPAVHVMVMTGTDPAFCSGADLKEWVSNPVGFADRERTPWRGILPPHRKPVIGAVNGPTATGGLELALNCDFLVASERAAFVDTHARVGVMPGAGLTVLLAQRIGVARAKEMSLTGTYIDAQTALVWGLVNRVVPHELLLPTARRLAAECAGIELSAMLRMRQTYEENAGGTLDEAWEREEAVCRAWARDGYDAGAIDGQRQDVVRRGRDQLGTETIDPATTSGS